MTPNRGDAIWLNFTPQMGREQSGRRPALVLSSAAYNSRVGLAVVCPITSQIKGYPFEVMLPAESPIHGVVLADQARSLDWRSRQAESIAHLTDEVTDEVVAKLAALVGFR
jgi:mRNA interferase MazF